MVPKGWVKIRLGSVAELQRGFDLPSSQRVDGCVPIVSSGGVTGYHNEAKSKAPGVVTGRYGSIGDVFYLDEDYWPLNTSLWVKDFHGNNEKFIYYLLSNFDFKKFSDKTGVPGVNRNDLHAVKVGLPPYPEQKKIAQILSTWDKAITTTEQLLANSQQQKKALMQQLLTGKKRLLDKSGVRFSGEWKFQCISQISKRIQRKSDGEDHPILTISSLSGFVRQDERYSRYMAGESVKNYILLKKGEFAYNKGNSKTYEFGCIFDLDSYKSGLVPHVYVCFKLHQGLSHRYFKYLFEADYLKPQLGALVNTGVRNNGLLNIKPAEFMNTKVPVPCFDEQEQIADVLHASSKTINKLQQKLDALKQEKKALMQQLLTGKRRVQLNEQNSKVLTYGN
ncbi:type I restriction modification DNA specificity domain protein [Vibrio paracholerae HE-16]|uniref:restriction endonuclease subunit S n=1 Tax=Vibrio TaxID=662 RepID=UPI00028EFC81|nr:MULTISPECIES: restriction endonuclease subunit S [Vibrio]EKG91969.1 type I restriction modification DNA specificity domain protein [Vibrio paracholerae HE-16]MBW5432266.1 restriction endonuclease subunit S [Vibrio cholerae]NAO20844.1 restriction endonuclease subunit S [Vibrio cholerae]NAO58496.1 restriction endonuclease subunit S [Vibrio cholerae]